MTRQTRLAPAYTPAILVSLALQATAIFAGVRLFEVMPAKVIFAALFGYWLTVIALILWHPTSPSFLALVYLALGFAAWLLAAHYAIPLIYGEDVR